MAYVYRHIRLDKNEPFYIGIGKTTYRHTSKQGRNYIWTKIVSKTEYIVEILFDDVDWEFACKKEIEFIELYGRINISTGILANMTNGGDGRLGCVHSEDAIKKISESSKGRPGHWKGKKMSEEAKRKLSESKMGKRGMGHPVAASTKEAVRKHSIGNKYSLGRIWTEEMRDKISKTKKERKIPGPNRKPVIQKNNEGDVISIYHSILEAHNKTGFTASVIGVKCRRGGGNYKGFYWQFYNK